MNNVFACIEILNVDEQGVFESATKGIEESGFHLLGLKMKDEIYYGSKETVRSLIFCRADKTLIIKSTDHFCTHDTAPIKLYVSRYNRIIKKIYTDLNRCDATNQ